MQNTDRTNPTPLVSVVIPTFNRANDLPDALKSVFAQTETRYEIIVVDDGSTDNTSEVIQPFLDRIQFIRQENGGASAARNTGIKASKGEFVAFLDSDDQWMPTKLERQLDVFNRRPEVDFVTCLAVTESIELSNRVPCTVRQQFLSSLVSPFPSNTSRYIVRRGCFERHGYFDSQLNGPEDWELWLRFLSKGSLLDCVREPLVLYKHSPDALSGNAVAMLKGETEIKRRYVDTLPSRWQRWWIGSRFLARSHQSAAVNYRDRGDHEKYRNHMRQSLIANPLFPRPSERLRALLKLMLAAN